MTRTHRKKPNPTRCRVSSWRSKNAKRRRLNKKKPQKNIKAKIVGLVGKIPLV